MKKTIIIISIIVLIGLIYYFVIYKKKAVSKDTEETLTKTKVNLDALNNTVFPLKKGSTGTEVKALQNFLNTVIQVPFNKLVVDGNFGTLTEEALKRYNGKTQVSLSDSINMNNALKNAYSTIINPNSGVFTSTDASKIVSDALPIVNASNVFSLVADNIV